MTAFINFVAYNNLNEEEMQKSDCRRCAISLDAREVVFTQKNRAIPTPDIQRSAEALKEWLEALPERKEAEFVVMTGYIASSHDGKPVTLGRDGSDYSASIAAAMLHADSVSIWTDVDGVFSANPNVVAGCKVRNELTYNEASEMAYFGAKVIHPKTMTPVLKDNIPIWLRNSFDPSMKGTVIQAEEKMTHSDHIPYGVKGLSYIENLCLICVEGTGLIGVPGVAQRLFGALRNIEANVTLISQAGSEHSICLCIPYNMREEGLKAVRREFRDEEEDGSIQRVDARGPCACLAIVGEGMKSTPGVAGKLCTALASARINITAIAQGSSERNISVVIDQDVCDCALQEVHRAFIETENAESRIESLRESIAKQQKELAELEKSL